MNKFDNRYEFRLAKREEIPQLMKFIEDYWGKNHILAHDRKLFDWMYVIKDDNEHVNVAVAIDKNTQTIEQFFGIIDCSATHDLGKKDIWGALWKVCPEHDNFPFLGVELVKRLPQIKPHREYLGNGSNPQTSAKLLRNVFHWYTENMKHYFLLNPNKTEFHIARIIDRPSPIVTKNALIKICTLTDINAVCQHFDFDSVTTIPYKDAWYFNHRYFEHPYYHYIVWGLQENDTANHTALLVMREVQANGAKALRIVDYMGDSSLLHGIYPHLCDYLVEHDYEYVDFYFTGLNEVDAQAAGFTQRREEDNNIIPNYFEPFEQKNVEIISHHMTPNALIFRGDGDQDRPNVIKI